MWIAIGAWIAAVVIAAVVLGYCAYEITWKSKRLQSDLRRMQSMSDEVAELRGSLAAVRERLGATGLR